MRFALAFFVASLCCINISMAQQTADKSKATYYALRLAPHQDLKKELLDFAVRNKIKAGFIATCVGSLEQVSLRMANQEKGEMYKGHFEIVSLVGTFSDSSSQIHLSVSDSTGKTIGGHLLDGSLIYTTAEIVVAELDELDFAREKDNTYGYNELAIKKRKPKKK